MKKGGPLAIFCRCGMSFGMMGMKPAKDGTNGEAERVT
jgi:hypothetical protein